MLDHQAGRLIGSPGLTGGSALGSVEAVAPTDDGGWILTGREFPCTFTNGRRSPPLIKVEASGQGLAAMDLGSAACCPLPRPPSVTVPSAPVPPDAPQALRADVRDRTVTLSWEAAPGNAERYIVEADSGPGLADLSAFDTANLDTTFSTTAPPGQYFVRVRASNAAGHGRASNEVTITVP